MAGPLFDLVLRLADDHLVLGHRLSEWCGHAPMLEEDLALPNMALDLIGQARALYAYAAEIEGAGKTEDDYAYLRGEREFRNLLLCERPNGDFAHTILRQLYFAAFMRPYWAEVAKGGDETLAGIAAKAEKEVAYHIRHAGEWAIRLGDGTEESARRMADAVEELEPYVAELFETDETAAEMAEAGVAPDPATLRPEFDKVVDEVFREGLLKKPDTVFPLSGGREGRHGEALGHLLAVMQSVHRAHPGAVW